MAAICTVWWHLVVLVVTVSTWPWWQLVQYSCDSSTVMALAFVANSSFSHSIWGFLSSATRTVVRYDNQIWWTPDVSCSIRSSSHSPLGKVSLSSVSDIINYWCFMQYQKQQPLPTGEGFPLQCNTYCIRYNKLLMFHAVSEAAATSHWGKFPSPM